MDKLLIIAGAIFGSASAFALRGADPCDIYDCTESYGNSGGAFFWIFCLVIALGIAYGLIFNKTFRGNFLYFVGGLGLMAYAGVAVMNNFGKMWGIVTVAAIGFLFYKGVDRFIK